MEGSNMDFQMPPPQQPLQPPVQASFALGKTVIQADELQGSPAEANSAGSLGLGSSAPSYFPPSNFSNYQSPYAIGSSTTTDLISAPFTKETSEVIARVKAHGVSDLTHGSAEWETAKQAVRAEMELKNTNGIPTEANPTAARTGGRRGRGPRRRGSPIPHDNSITHDTIVLTPIGTIAPADPPVTPSETPIRRVRGRGGRPRGSRGARGSSRSNGKRKRDRNSDEDGNTTSSSEEFTSIPTQSRSGRKIIQASTSTPLIKTEPNESQRSPLSLAPTQVSAKILNKQKFVKRTPGASAVCKNCGRGHSPSSNAIVFCDGCNTPWHQHCHDPPIKKDYLIIPDKEWFCADCVILREEQGKLKGKVAGDGMGLAEKRKYLQTLSHNTLVSFLLHASSLHPSLPIYPPKVYIPISPNNTSSANGAVEVTVVREEEYYSEDELPYPKAGNGIQLPPEHEDVSILVDTDTDVFSHRWEGIAQMLAEVQKMNLGSPNKNMLGVRTGANNFRVQVST